MKPTSKRTITTDEISEWKTSVVERFDKEPGYAMAMSRDYGTQRMAEAKWVEALVVHEGLVSSCKRSSMDARKRLAFALFGGDYSASVVADPRGEVLLVKQSDDVQTLRHEALVAILGTNALGLPNFPFAYALSLDKKITTKEWGNIDSLATPQPATDAAPPAADKSDYAKGEQKMLASVSSKNEAILYGFPLGFGKDGCVTLADAIENGMSSADFAEVFIQLCYALKVASRDISFTHYMLSPSNVYLVPTGVSENAFIPYDNQSVFVRAKYIAVMSDFSRSHISVQNSDLRPVSIGYCQRGGHRLASIGLFRDRCNVMTDVYRLAVLSAKAASVAGNTEIFSAVETVVMGYFNSSETMSEIIERQHDTDYYLPLTQKTRVFNLDELISHANKRSKAYKGFVGAMLTPQQQPPPSSGVLWGRLCLPYDSIPLSFAEFFETYHSMTELLDTANGVDVAKAFADDFMTGYTSGTSKFHRCVVQLEKDMKEAVASIKDYSKKKALISSNILKPMTEQITSFGYVIAVYWPPEDEEKPPVEVEELRHKCRSFLSHLGELAAAAATL